MALLVYVDDILITGPSNSAIVATKEILKSSFMLKDLGNAKYFLGLELSWLDHGIYLSQRKYCLQILEDLGSLEVKPTSFPMTPNIKLSATSGIPLNQEDISTYRRLVGHLLYLQISRPNICFAVHKLSQYIAKPYSHHLTAIYPSITLLERNCRSRHSPSISKQLST